MNSRTVANFHVQISENVDPPHRVRIQIEALLRSEVRAHILFVLNPGETRFPRIIRPAAHWVELVEKKPELVEWCVVVGPGEECATTKLEVDFVDQILLVPKLILEIAILLHIVTEFREDDTRRQCDTDEAHHHDDHVAGDGE